jgi:hypothetical protein
MKHCILPVLIIFSILAFSCAGRKSKAIRKDLIPEKELVSILTDLHLADGLLALPDINYLYQRGDTLTNYIHIIEKYGFTKDQMDRTMRFYFIKRPKSLIKIYDKVLGRISEMESRVTKEIPAFYAHLQKNIWPGKQFYSIPYHSGNDTTWFDFPVDFTGTCALEFSLTIYPDDQSVNPCSGIYFFRSDSAGNESRIDFPEIRYLKDGRQHNYNVTVKQNLSPPLRLRGWFVDQEGQAPFPERHIFIENIGLTRKFL